MMAGLALASNGYKIYFPSHSFVSVITEVPGSKIDGKFVVTKDENYLGINKGLRQPTKSELNKWASSYREPNLPINLSYLAEPVANQVNTLFESMGLGPVYTVDEMKTVLGPDLKLAYNAFLDLVQLVSKAGLVWGVSPYHVMTELKRDPNAYIMIDVRPDKEYNAFHIPGVLHVPKESLEGYLKTNPISKDRKIIFVCNAGISSANAALIAKGVGYRNVLSLAGGTAGWPTPGDVYDMPLVVGDKYLASSTATTQEPVEDLEAFEPVVGYRGGC
jgi:rhodanese-related sulfurtransferase